MRPILVIVGEVLAEKAPEVAVVENDGVVERVGRTTASSRVR